MKVSVQAIATPYFRKIHGSAFKIISEFTKKYYHKIHPTFAGWNENLLAEVDMEIWLQPQYYERQQKPFSRKEDSLVGEFNIFISGFFNYYAIVKGNPPTEDFPANSCWECIFPNIKNLGKQTICHALKSLRRIVDKHDIILVEARAPPLSNPRNKEHEKLIDYYKSLSFKKRTDNSYLTTTVFQLLQICE